ncbi:polymorphic toxin-type HINT domain-containing protein [Rugosimonospora africana]|uniref:polymorphic toxin-type HINT domain-containing protein n=1 Tax=Rugosimonospora africana TaxID=556532 RepID=UPI0019434043|nr:polymorphic toxin-type HINT domain-containing protein [Rugosimonospora africana]
MALLDHASTLRAGVHGMLFTVRAADGSSSDSAVGVSVDYSAIVNAYGGDWANRLHLVELPSCAVTTPQVGSCRVQKPVATQRDTASKLLSGQASLRTGAAGSEAVQAPRQVAPSVVLGVDGDPAGNAGDYTATGLKPSGTWSAGGSSGDFNYSYPIAVPPVPGQFTPDVTLSYSSQSVDGEQVATNTQSSWVGDGWDYTPGYVERSYIDCADDPAGTAPKTGDNCWAGQVVHLSLGSRSGDLVYDTSAPTHWKISGDDGSVVELLTGATNGDNDGEYWKITTQDGTQYFFGRNRLPGYTSDTATPPTNSTFTERVYGAHDGDPCHDSAGFASSSCNQGWRWNLDYVIDSHHNAQAFYYKTETNYYGADSGTTGVSYVRGGYLDHIDYGLVDPNPYPGHAPAQVTFGVDQRCVVSTSACAPANIDTTPSNWPDVPYDQNCKKDAVCNVHSQTFWSQVRLTSITTSVWGGTATIPVDTYRLTQTLPDPEDGTGTPALWLASIQHTGNVGGSIDLPAVAFAATNLPNRADSTVDHAPAMNHNRISTITTETGEVVGVNYQNPGCVAPVSTDPSQNTSLCYPVYWTQEGTTQPARDWFNKYVVTEIDDQDPTGKSATVTTKYGYPNPPAWHFDNNELVKPNLRTYGQWRGYGVVQTRTGAGTDARTLSEAYYFRGMDGDSLPSGGHRTATVTLSSDVTVPGAASSVADTDQLAGQVREQLSYNGDGGPPNDATVTDYWVSSPTATRTRTGLPALTSVMVRPVTTYATAAITSGATTTWRTTKTEITYNTAIGLPTVVYHHGDITDPSQATCTVTSYAPAADGTNLVSLPAEVENDAKPCGGSGVNGLTAPTSLTRPADVISDTRAFYDDPSFATTWPQSAVTTGQTNMVRQAIDYASGAFTYITKAKTLYDGYGRTTASTDADGNTTTLSYTTTNGLTTSTTTTNPLHQATTATLDPTHGVTTKTVDPNLLETDLRYDALGRITGVWLPGNNDTAKQANQKYSYLISQTQPSAVTSASLNEHGSYTTSVTFYDALDRQRQTQSDSPAGGRLVTDTFYDSRGWAYKTNNANWDDSSTPSTTLLDMRGLDEKVPNQDVITFDGLGRPVLDVSRAKGVEQWHTQTVYGGDRTTVIPPDGGTPVTTLTDTLGRTIEQDSYSSAPTVTGNRVTGGSFVPITYGYDHRGNQNSITDDQHNTWTSTIDLLGHTVTQTDPDSGTSQRTYDNNGNVLTATDARSNTISYSYDPLNRKTFEYDGPDETAPKLAEWHYDSTDIVNGIGQLSSETSYSGTTPYTSTISGYSNRYLPLETTITIPTDGALAGSYTFTNTYAPTTGALSKTDYPATSGALPKETVNYGYNTQGQLVSVGGGGPYIEATTFTPYGEPERVQLGILTNQISYVSNIYDPHTRQVKDTTVDRSVTPSRVDDVAYTYNHAGLITQSTDTRNNTTSETQCFDYDLLGRLTTAWTASDACANDVGKTGTNSTVGGINPYWTSWTFTDDGDRKTETQHALPTQPAGDTTSTYTYPTGTNAQPNTVQSVATVSPAGTQTSTYTYDNAGNTLNRTTPATGSQTLTWNDLDQLSQVTAGTKSSSYVYDADGGLLLQRDPGTTTLYLPGEELHLNTGTNTLTGQRYYTANDVTCVRTGTTSTAYNYLLADQHGTATLSLDHTGQTPSWRAFTPYGAPRSSTVPWPDTHAFLGQPTDSLTNLDLLGARNYDPTTGRFVSVDPIMEPADPNQLGGYSYSGNDPVNKTDPDGTLGCVRLDIDGPCVPNNPPSGNNSGGGGGHSGGGGGGGSGSGDIPLQHGTVVNVHQDGTVTVDGITISATSVNDDEWRFAQQVDAYYDPTWGKDAAAQVLHAMDLACQHEAGVCTEAFARDISSAMADRAAWINKCRGSCWQFQLSLGGVANAVALGGEGPGGDDRLGAVNPDVAEARGVVADAVEEEYADIAGLAEGDISKLRTACGGNSFDQHTGVLMANGTTEPINQVKIGDEVLATDPTTGTTAPRHVTALHLNQDTGLTDLTVATSDGSTAALHTTQHHPFWDATRHAWIDAADLLPGDRLHTLDGQVETVAAVHSFTQQHPMYNLTIETTHTYFVIAGTTPVLVHNAGCGPDVVLGPGVDNADALRSWSSTTPETEFIYDPATGDFLAGDRTPPATHNSGPSPHEQLVEQMGATDPKAIVGGTMYRDTNGSLVFTQVSGHFGQNWTAGSWQQFKDFMGNYGIQAEYRPWG